MFWASFANPIAGLLSPTSVRRAVHFVPLILPAPKNAVIRVAIDPSELHAAATRSLVAVVAGVQKETDDGDAPALHVLAARRSGGSARCYAVFKEIARTSSTCYGVDGRCGPTYTRNKPFERSADVTGVSVRFRPTDCARTGQRDMGVLR